MEPFDLKQVIVMRDDLSMRRGKQIAQGAHAAMKFLLEGDLSGTDVIERWVDEGMTKICLRVSSEADLFALEESAKKAGLVVHLIRDLGRTEFHGVETPTCLAIGPCASAMADEITGHLNLY